jgi:hypothetical protein
MYSRIFSVLEMASGFQQFEIKSENKWKAAFNIVRCTVASRGSLELTDHELHTTDSRNATYSNTHV